jgi:signal transduction histidine kinase
MNKGVYIGLDIDNTNGLTIISDKLKLTRIIINLLHNSIKFTPREKSIFVRTYNKQQQLYIEVQDEGIGIPNDKLTDIFRPHVRLDDKGPGMGIGLSICKDLLEQLKGDIMVSSVVGEGSTFTVLVPITIY